jgi:hypothetical protein
MDGSFQFLHISNSSWDNSCNKRLEANLPARLAAAIKKMPFGAPQV